MVGTPRCPREKKWLFCSICRFCLSTSKDLFLCKVWNSVCVCAYLDKKLKIKNPPRYSYIVVCFYQSMASGREKHVQNLPGCLYFWALISLSFMPLLLLITVVRITESGCKYTSFFSSPLLTDTTQVFYFSALLSCWHCSAANTAKIECCFTVTPWRRMYLNRCNLLHGLCLEESAVPEMYRKYRMPIYREGGEKASSPSFLALPEYIFASGYIQNKLYLRSSEGKKQEQFFTHCTPIIFTSYFFLFINRLSGIFWTKFKLYFMACQLLVFENVLGLNVLFLSCD